LAIYQFIACDQKLPSFEEALADEEVKSYNDLLKMGLTEEQIQIRGIDLTGIDRNKKVFLITLPEEFQNCSLTIEEDFQKPYAPFLSDRKFIYKVTSVEKAISQLGWYIGKYTETWKELELWRVIEDDYCVDSGGISQTIINIRNMTLDKLEDFYDGPVPNRIVLVQY